MTKIKRKSKGPRAGELKVTVAPPTKAALAKIAAHRGWKHIEAARRATLALAKSERIDVSEFISLMPPSNKREQQPA